MNDDVTLREIENALEGVDGLDWSPVEDPDLVSARSSPHRLYRLTLAADALACPDVRHLELAVPVNDHRLKAGGFGLRLEAGLVGPSADGCSLTPH